MTPKLSVIIASTTGPAYLAECLSALARQTGNIDAEVIVIDRTGRAVTTLVTEQFPGVRLISCEKARSVPDLRATGIRAAQGEIITITEDHCIPPSGWYEAICHAHAARSEPAIGGSVDNGATQRLIDWAVFFCEYSNFISPVTQGAVHDLPGPNVSYKRAALLAALEPSGKEFWETVIHSQFEAQGYRLWAEPSLSMLHKKHFTLSGFLAERFHYSRAFAGKRNATITRGRRLCYFLLTPLLPPLMLRRIGQRVLSRGRHRGIFVRTLPYLMLFTVVWAFGESVGYSTGSGQSALRLE